MCFYCTFVVEVMAKVIVALFVEVSILASPVLLVTAVDCVVEVDVPTGLLDGQRLVPGET